jgi:CheY-like chemotaxis protein
MSRTTERLVLIVEHDVWLRSMLCSVFERAECEVVCASNGFGGLRRAVELRPRLVVLGAALPELSPAELAEELRAAHHFSGTQIVSVERILSGTSPDRSPTRAPIGRPRLSRSPVPVAAATRHLLAEPSLV